jgi:hypothetical protein
MTITDMLFEYYIIQSKIITGMPSYTFFYVRTNNEKKLLVFWNKN